MSLEELQQIEDEYDYTLEEESEIEVKVQEVIEDMLEDMSKNQVREEIEELDDPEFQDIVEQIIDEN